MRSFLLCSLTSVLLFCCTPSTGKQEYLDTIELIQNKPKNFEQLLRPYKGRVVYLDIWASWCGPCLREMPASEELKRSLTGTNIEFLYLSVDEQQQRWSSTVQARQIVGRHYLASTSLVEELEQRFGFKSIPRYMMIDRDGVIVDGNAPRPSDAVTKSLLKNLSKQP